MATSLWFSRVWARFWPRGYYLSVHNGKVVEGVDRIRRKIEHNEMLRQVHAQVSTILREAPAVEMTKAKLPGDSEALRGLPAVARGVRGAIRHTEPERETVERMTRNGF